MVLCVRINRIRRKRMRFTRNEAEFGDPMYWIALVLVQFAGFLAPLTYNYFKLAKYNRACH